MSHRFADALAVATVVAMVALLSWIVVEALLNNRHSCEETGGQMVLRGFIQSGKVLVPHYTCQTN